MMKYKNIRISNILIFLFLVLGMVFYSGCSSASVIKTVKDGIVKENSEKETEEETRDLSYLKDYYNLIVKYEKQYGKAKKDKESSYLLKGLCCANLVDFNQDGIEELMLAYGKENEYSMEYRYEVWAYCDGEMVQAGEGTPVGYDGNTHEVMISDFNGQKYLVSGGGDQSMQYQFYRFDGRSMKKDIEFQSVFDGGETTNYYIDGTEASEEEYDRTFNSRWIHVNTTSLHDSSENSQKLKANRELISLTKTQCKKCQIEEEHLENKSKILEVSEYFEKWESLITDLNMELMNSKKVMEEGTAYAFGMFYLENHESNYYIRNQAENGITLYGMSPGDSINDIDKIMKEKGWEIFYEYDKVHEYILLDDNMNYFVQIEADAAGKIRYWELYNYPPTYAMEWTFKQMRIDALTGWKRQYYDYLQELPDNHATDNLEVQYLYIDDDNTPEMLINYGSYADGGELCYMSVDEMKVQSVGAYGVSYIEKTGLFCNSGGHMDVYYDDIFKLQNGNLKTIAEGNYGAEDNANVQVDENGMPIYEYYWNNKMVTQQKYNSNLGKVYDKSRSKSPYGSMMSIWDAQDKLVTME